MESFMIKKQTSKKVATEASKALKSSGGSNKSRSIAGSTLSQRLAPKKETSTKIAVAASKSLRGKETPKPSKSIAGSTLTQKTASKKVAAKKAARSTGTGNTGPRKQ